MDLASGAPGEDRLALDDDLGDVIVSLLSDSINAIDAVGRIESLCQERADALR